MAAPQLDSTGVVANPVVGPASSDNWCDVGVGGVVCNTFVPGVTDLALEKWKTSR